ncbi:putative FAD-linked sulfhydryl oxidase [Tripterygium wilfordii]|uniref:Sulfhydryl oxidase n=1 Tax=Tripterygium wilfordii TaxID=458696 RepID=A0A7J7CGM2_TRIWF|nr:putative FAD-linked sulfhydryl oxidase [Tripterygium wilfordii]
MSDNPWQPLFQTVQKFSNCIETHLFNFIGHHTHHPSPPKENPFFSLHSSSSSKVNPINHGAAIVQTPDSLPNKEKATSPVTKEELGRATWTFIHTLAAQALFIFQNFISKAKKKKLKHVVFETILSLYAPFPFCLPFNLWLSYILGRANLVQAGSHAEFSQWLCHVHNVVNRRVFCEVRPFKTFKRSIYIHYPTKASQNYNTSGGTSVEHGKKKQKPRLPPSLELAIKGS